MAQIHAGAPDWWKYNINSNELFGLNSENPLFINLESTLNPLNGLTGVDFNDRNKRVNWWTSLLDDLGKFGPSTWTPLNLAVAWALKEQGEEEAASRWGGRLIPQTQTIEAIQSILEEGVTDFAGISFEGVGKDSFGWMDWMTKDPALSIFSNGIDPYTRRRIGRALGAMIQEGMITPEQGLDAARTQEGRWWELAHERAINNRAPGQIMSFLGASGLRARTAQDMEIDRFDTQYFALWNSRPNLSPQEFQRSMSNLRQAFPFMDTVILSRQAGEARDTTYAYNVLARIPPGESSVQELVGLDRELISKFYDSKGNISEWAESDRLRFMASVVDLGAVLQSPDDATRDEWIDAKFQYTGWREQVIEDHGEDIHDLIDTYYAIRRNESPEEGYEFLDEFPQVGAALDLRAQMQIANPRGLFATYYGSLSSVEAYYKGLFYEEAEDQFGEGIWELVRGHSPLTATERRAYRRENPELVRYWELRDDWTEVINRQMILIGTLFPEPIEAVIRPGVDPASLGQEALLEGLRNEELPITPNQWVALVGVTSVAAVQDFNDGTEIPREVMSLIFNSADRLDISADRLIQLIGISLRQAVPQ